MGKVSNKVAENILEKEYASVGDVIKFLNMSVDDIQSTFSFTPYIDGLEKRMCNACDGTKSVLLPIIEKNNVLTQEGVITLEELAVHPHFKTLVDLIVPSMLFIDQLSYIAAPFKKNMIVKTAALENMINDDQWLMKVDPSKLLSYKNFATRDASVYILNKFYNQNLSFNTNEILTLRHIGQGIEKHYQTLVNFDFVDVSIKGDPPKLSQPEINHLIHHYENEELWNEKLPLDQFAFTGFTVGTLHDITEIETLSQLKQWVRYESEKIDKNDFLPILASYIKSFLQIKDLECGNMVLNFEEIQENTKFSLTGKSDISEIDYIDNSDNKGGIFHKIMVEKLPEYISDLNTIKYKSEGEKLLAAKGYRSIILNPITDPKNNICGILGLASKIPDVFNALTVVKLKEIFNIIELGYDRYLKKIEASVAAIIQQNFTSIHPSVEWKFQQVALEQYISESKGLDKAIAPIVFQDVHPLYAQSDIVSSSIMRSAMIQQDLEENLELLLEVVSKWLRKDTLFLLDAYKTKIENKLQELNNNFVSNDETKIVSFLVNEIHPMLHDLYSRYSDLPSKVYKNYLSRLDPEIGVIYTRRRSFEHSVVKVRNTISKFLSKDEKKLQKYLPHYFEKYKTDGVEYNMYVGQSLLKDKKFRKYDLQNFRLWQLVNTCEITRLVKKIQPELSISLETAELIFVYNHPLSIRFRMDEKKFDVDGSYNVRYEILKKRIDKAIIKGTKERLTVAGKIAIVYLDEDDKNEYIDYINYLIDKGYVDEAYEDLVLDTMQGAEGLKALRVTVL